MSEHHLPDGWVALDQAARDATYNNGNATPGRDALVIERDSAAMAYRAAHPDLLDIPYGPGERQRWDLFPAARADAPCLVFIHGGYWQYNGRENFSAIAE